MFTSRDTVIGRTAKSRNFARNFKRKRYHMNPFMENLKLNGEFAMSGLKFER